jgi:hypothetical protein
MQHIFETNGNLTFLVENSQEDLQTIKDRVGGDDVAFLVEMLDTFGYAGNGVLSAIRPVDVGALTDAPMLSDGVALRDSGETDVTGKVWWFPNYQVEDFATTLLEKGRVTFTLAL